jgi:phage major head subunit gpT-like protein
MMVNSQNVELAFRGFQKVYNTAFEDAVSHRDTLAMVVNSTTSEENYGWLGQFPDLRRWLGDRVVKNLETHGFKIVNELYESTVRITRDDFEDDKLGVYAPMYREMGRVAKQHPDRMLLSLLSSGFMTPCYDGQPFFSEAHPMSGKAGDDVVFSNMQPGAGRPWYLLDLSRAIKPMIWQERVKYDLQAITNPDNSIVFMSNDFLFGVRARVNCGFGLWQLGYGSQADLTPANYEAARTQMMRFAGDRGQLLGIMPTHLVVPPSLEGKARQLLTADLIANDSNIWKGTAELIVTPFLS